MRGAVRAGRWVVAGLVPLIVLVGGGGPALADPYPAGSQQPARVLGEKFFSGDGGGGGAASAVGGGGGAPGAIAFTGFHLLLLVAIALAAIAAGVLLRRAHDRRTAAAD
jgi:hypothetical protein